MGIKEVLLGEDNKLDRDDPLFWLSVIGIIIFLSTEAYDKFMNSIKISEMAYILLIATSLGRTAIKALFMKSISKPEKSVASKKEDHEDK